MKSLEETMAAEKNKKPSIGRRVLALGTATAPEVKAPPRGCTEADLARQRKVGAPEK
jgi:hypothetical protein